MIPNPGEYWSARLDGSPLTYLIYVTDCDEETLMLRVRALGEFRRYFRVDVELIERLAVDEPRSQTPMQANCPWRNLKHQNERKD